MLKKDLIHGMRMEAGYRDDYTPRELVWNRTNEWQMQSSSVIRAREKHGKDWIKRDALIWRFDRLDDGRYTDSSWPHWRRYTKEHNTFL
jgi:hypothetical protein